VRVEVDEAERGSAGSQCRGDATRECDATREWRAGGECGPPGAAARGREGRTPARLDAVTRSHRSHENIIAILDIIVPNHYRDFHEVYLVQELMETDL
jgi:hypothetical protein